MGGLGRVNDCLLPPRPHLLPPNRTLSGVEILVPHCKDLGSFGPQKGLQKSLAGTLSGSNLAAKELLLIDRAPGPPPQIRNRFRTEPINKKRAPTKNPSGSIRTPLFLTGAVAHRSGSGTDTPKQKPVPNRTGKFKKASGQEAFREHSHPFGFERGCCSSIGLRHRHPKTEIGSEQYR